MATELTTDLGNFLPNRPLIAEPTSGSAMMIQSWSSICIRISED